MDALIELMNRYPLVGIPVFAVICFAVGNFLSSGARIGDGGHTERRIGDGKHAR